MNSAQALIIMADLDKFLSYCNDFIMLIGVIGGFILAHTFYSVIKGVTKSK